VDWRAGSSECGYEAGGVGKALAGEHDDVDDNRFA